MANTAAVLDVVLKAQTAKASLELKKFNANLERTSRQARDTDRSVVASEKNVRSFGSGISDANQRMMLFKNTASLIKWPALIAGAGGAAQAVSALGAGAAGLASALAPLSGLVAAYPALLGAMGQAAGVTALAGIDDLTSAVGGLNEKMDETSTEFKKLSPEGQKFARSLNQMKGPIKDIQTRVQKPLFEGMNEGLDEARKNLPVLKSVLGDTADVMGDLAEKAGEFVGRKGFGRDFAKVGANNAQLLGRLGDAGLNFGDALRHIMVVARPLIDFLGKGVVKFSEWVEEQAKAGRESGRMADFFDRTQKVIRQLVSIGTSLGSVFLDIGHAARPLGEDIMKTLVDQAEKLAHWTSTNQGALRAYFEDARAPLAETGKLLKDIVGSFFSLSSTSGLAGFIRQIRKDLLPAIVEMTQSTTKQFLPKLIDLFTETAKLLTNFMGSNGTLTLFVEGLTTAGKLLNNLFEAIPGLAQAASTALTGFSIFKLLGLTGLTGGAAAGKTGIMAKAGGFLARGLSGALGGALISTPVVGTVALGISGLISAATTEGGVIDTINGEGTKIAEKFGDAVAGGFGPKIESAISRHSVPALNRLADHLNALVDEFQKAGTEIPNALQKAATRANAAATRMGNKLEDLRDDIFGLEHAWGMSLSDILSKTQSNFQRIQDTMGAKSGRGTKLVIDNFEAAKNAIKNSMEAGKISTERGMAAIEKLLIQKLRSFGITDPKGFIARDEAVRAPGHLGGLQRGGPAASLVPGSGSGDRIPALLEPGELVVNRRAVAAMGGANKANRINSLIPRFARGGTVPGDTAGLNPGILGLVNKLYSRYGGFVTSGLRAADLGSLHSTGNAADYVPNDWAGAARAANAVGPKLLEGIYTGFHGGPQVSWDSGHQVDPSFWGSDWLPHNTHIHLAIAGAVGKVIGAVAEKIKLGRYTSDFALGALVAGGLNNASAAIEAKINKQLSRRTGVTMDSGAIPTTSGSFGKSQLMKLWSATGSNGDPNLMAAIALAESSGNPNADNGVARGLWQIISGTWSQYGKGSWDNAFDPTMNAQAAHRILAGAGLGSWDVYNSGAYRNFLQSGGIVQKFQGGGVGKRKNGKDKPTAVVGPGEGGRGSGFASLPPAIKNALQDLYGHRHDVEGLIATQEVRDAFASSPAGADLSAGERFGQIFLNRDLLDTLVKIVRRIRSGLKSVHPDSPAAHNLRTRLAELLGSGSDVGSVLTARAHLDDLMHPGAAEPTGTEDLLTPLLQARNEQLMAQVSMMARTTREFGSFFGTPLPPYGGTFHSGGVVPGSPGQERTIIAKGGEAVGPQPVYIVVEDGAVNSDHIRAVSGAEYEQRMRGAARRTMSGSPRIGRKVG